MGDNKEFCGVNAMGPLAVALVGVGLLVALLAPVEAKSVPSLMAQDDFSTFLELPPHYNNHMSCHSTCDSQCQLQGKMCDCVCCNDYSGSLCFMCVQEKGEDVALADCPTN